MTIRNAPITAPVPTTSLNAKAVVCPHCGVRVLSQGRQFTVSRTRFQVWPCNNCWQDTIFVAGAVPPTDTLREALGGADYSDQQQVVPAPVARGRMFQHVPVKVAKAYDAAVQLEAVYGPAAAAMARKSIELLLEVRGYRQRSLVEKIDALAGETDPERRVSLRLIGLLQALREFGNIGLHPVRSVSTTEILDVEPAEVAVCITTAEELMEELCERPAKERAALTPMVEKLRDAGKARAADTLSAILSGGPTPPPDVEPDT